MMRFQLIACLVLVSFLVNGQAKKLSKKEIIGHLAGNSWLVTHTWDGAYPEETPNDVPQITWTEVPMNDSRHFEYFGPEKITLASDGTFTATLMKGGSMKGKWTVGKKGNLAFTYTDEYDFVNTRVFENLILKPSGFVASGDICSDGCFAKVEFEKVNP